MKKLALVVVLAAVLVVGGCQTLGNLFCKVDDSQKTQAQQYLAAAQASVNALTPIIATNPAAAAAVAALNLAIPVFEAAVAGTCVAISQWQNAVNAVPPANNVAKMAVPEAVNSERAARGLAPL